MELQTYFLIGSSAISLFGIIATIATTIAKQKNTKSVKLAKILQALPSYIQEAESIFGARTGVAKLAYVLNKINIDCLSSGVAFNSEEWTVEIEDILSTPQKKI